MRVSGGASTDRGYLDHLFLDQDAVPTLVKVKSSEKTQIRREAVSQMKSTWVTSDGKRRLSRAR
jgi:hypothetical protein